MRRLRRHTRRLPAPGTRRSVGSGSSRLVVIIGIAARDEQHPILVARRRWWLVLWTAGMSSSDSNKAGSKSNPFKVGDTVELEGTQYTVESARKGKSVGGQYSKEEAGGVFVIVELTIENKKNETKTFSSNAAKVIGGNGKSYSTDDEGTFAMIGTGGETLILEEMQPDVPEKGTLVYDLPVGKAKGSMLEVSDLFGGGEAYIDLGL